VAASLVEINLGTTEADERIERVRSLARNADGAARRALGTPEEQ
jgi:hypothetical protein